MVDVNKLKKVHFIGIGGIGVSALLRLFASRDIAISGSDLTLPALSTLPQGTYHSGHDGAHVPSDADLVIYSPAVPDANPERQAARERNTQTLSYPEALALVTAPYNTIAVSGTHGKSTTTALLGKLFEAGNLDPTVIVGAEVPGWERNLRIGKSTLCIVEACEYRRHMLQLSPQAILLTNLELDHPDYYKDLADIKSAFADYIAKLSGEDLLIINNDDANLRDVARNTDAITVYYGVGEGADLVASNIGEEAGRQSFELSWKGTDLGVFTTLLPGLYNVYNILGAVATYLSYGGNQDAVQKVLETFAGVGRRFEVVGTLDGKPVISDYAHHPTALAAVTEAARARFPGKRLLVAFRPHQKERTIKLMPQFIDVVSQLPDTILIEIYDVAGREEAQGVSSRDIASGAKEKNPAAHVEFAEDLTRAEELIRNKASNYDVILVAGAGDAEALAGRLVSEREHQQSLFHSQPLSENL